MLLNGLLLPTACWAVQHISSAKQQVFAKEVLLLLLLLHMFATVE